MKTLHFTIIPLLLILCSACNIQNNITEQECLDGLKITLQANLEFRKFDYNCGVINGKKVCKIILIPMKKDLIDIAVEYKSIREKLSEEEKSQLLQKNYKEFLTGDKSGFIFIINTSAKDTDKQVYFKDFKSNVLLKTEDDNNYHLLSYTKSYEEILNPGWNRGYLFFPNFRKTPLNSYSVHFDELYLNCGGNAIKTKMPAWSFSFDESELQYLSLVQKGLSVKDFRKKYIVRTYEQIGIDAEDLANLLVFVLKTIASVA